MPTFLTGECILVGGCPAKFVTLVVGFHVDVLTIDVPEPMPCYRHSACRDPRQNLEKDLSTVIEDPPHGAGELAI